MQTQNIVSGPGADRHVELGAGCRRNSRTYNTAVRKEHREYRLGLSETVRHADLVEGDVVSLQEGKVVPLREELGFAGIIDGVGQSNSGAYIAGVVVRAAVSAPVFGLLPTTPQGALVFCVPGSRTQGFSLEDNGLLAGEILAIEGSANRAIIGIRLKEDSRPFRLR